MRVLVLTHRLPYAPNRGDRLRMYHMLQHLRGRADIDLVSFVHDDDEAAHAGDLESMVATVSTVRVPKWRNRLNAAATLLTDRPLTHALLDAPDLTTVVSGIVSERRPDVVLAYCSGMARFAMEPPLDEIPMVLDFVDVDSRKWRDLAEVGRPPLKWIYRREARTLGAFEAAAARKAVTALVVNDREASNARALAPSADVRVVLNGVEVDRLRSPRPPVSNPTVVFCGMMDYHPNHEGMMWFVDAVWPLIRASRPDAALTIVGANPLRALTHRCASDPSITVTGRVDDVRDWLWNAAVAVAPLHIARGVQNKALEAIAAGLPVVMTGAVAAGLPRNAANASMVADAPDAFAGHVVTLLNQSAAERRAIAESCDFETLKWSATLERLCEILEHAAGSQCNTVQWLPAAPRAIGSREQSVT
jgi:sugar transferase (PEP-CTERM/EpsH1 system associated)